jgi:hypothetical protein
LPDALVLESAALNHVLEELRRRGYETVGPTVREGAIAYDTLDSIDDLPVGWTDRQRPGSYRLERRDDDRRFGYVVPQDSWKRFLFPQASIVWAGERVDHTFTSAPFPDAPATAVIGARPCELAAIAIQDKVFLGGSSGDPTYRPPGAHVHRRRQL